MNPTVFYIHLKKRIPTITARIRPQKNLQSYLTINLCHSLYTKFTTYYPLSLLQQESQVSHSATRLYCHHKHLTDRPCHDLMHHEYTTCHLRP